MKVKFISESDYYKVQLATLVSNVDIEVIERLYQPLIGALATILYLNLLDDTKREDDYVLSIGDLILKMQISPNMLDNAKKALEGVGLLKSYLKEDQSGRYYIFEIFAPKAPRDFFDDILLKGVLVQYVGEQNARRLASEYRLSNVIPEGYKDQSSSFVEAFNPDFDDPCFIKEFDKNIAGRKVGKVKVSFDPKIFFDVINKESQISKEVFNAKDLKEIERLATLYGLDEESVARIIISIYNPDKKEHINHKDLSKACRESISFTRIASKSHRKSVVSDKSSLGQKVKLMDELPPAQWLRVLQNNTKPANKDLITIDKLSSNYGFSNGVINVIIDYVLYKNENVLTYNYCETIAASLAREGVETAIDAMNYLNRRAMKNNETYSNNKNDLNSNLDKKVEKNENENTHDSLTNEEMRKKIMELAKTK